MEKIIRDALANNSSDEVMREISEDERMFQEVLPYLKETIREFIENNFPLLFRSAIRDYMVIADLEEEGEEVRAEIEDDLEEFILDHEAEGDIWEMKNLLDE